MKLTLSKSDNIGILASTLCMLHCIATPFLFIVQTCSTSCCNATPTWWQWIDYIFLTISFFAVYHSTKNTSNTIIKPALWINWLALFTVILNEKTQLINLHETIKYIVALLLVGLHLYNQKYCQCKNDKCCTKHG